MHPPTRRSHRAAASGASPSRSEAQDSNDSSAPLRKSSDELFLRDLLLSRTPIAQSIRQGEKLVESCVPHGSRRHGLVEGFERHPPGSTLGGGPYWHRLVSRGNQVFEWLCRIRGGDAAGRFAALRRLNWGHSQKINLSASGSRRQIGDIRGRVARADRRFESSWRRPGLRCRGTRRSCAWSDRTRGERAERRPSGPGGGFWFGDSWGFIKVVENIVVE